MRASAEVSTLTLVSPWETALFVIPVLILWLNVTYLRYQRSLRRWPMETYKSQTDRRIRNGCDFNGQLYLELLTSHT